MDTERATAYSIQFSWAHCYSWCALMVCSRPKLLTPADRNKFPILHLTLRSLHDLESSLQLLPDILSSVHSALSTLFFRLDYWAGRLHISGRLYLALCKLKLLLPEPPCDIQLSLPGLMKPLGVNLGRATNFCLEIPTQLPTLLGPGHALLENLKSEMLQSPKCF